MLARLMPPARTLTAASSAPANKALSAPAMCAPTLTSASWVLLSAGLRLIVSTRLALLFASVRLDYIRRPMACVWPVLMARPLHLPEPCQWQSAPRVLQACMALPQRLVGLGAARAPRDRRRRRGASPLQIASVALAIQIRLGPTARRVCSPLPTLVLSRDSQTWGTQGSRVTRCVLRLDDNACPNCLMGSEASLT